MINPQLLDYVRQQLAAGISKEEISKALVTNGWQVTDINDVLAVTSSMPTTQLPVQASSLNFMQPAAVSVGTSHAGMWAIVIVLLLLVGAGGAFAAYQAGLFTSPVVTQVPVANTEASTTPVLPVTGTTEASSTIASTTQNNLIATSSTLVSTTTAKNAVCDNYQCLIAAALQCQPIAVTISYSGVPFTLDTSVLVSGQTKYEIKKSAGVNNCVLTFSSPTTSFSITDAGRKAALASGMTDAQITAQLQTMNGSSKTTARAQSTCVSNATTIAAYLTDTKNGNSNVESDSETATFTTSSGQKLVCATTFSPK